MHIRFSLLFWAGIAFADIQKGAISLKKILFVANVLKKHICVFHMPLLEKLKKEGYEIHIAARNDADEHMRSLICDRYYNIPFIHSPFHIQNLHNYRMLRSLLETEHFDIIHCHTPIASVLLRLACKKTRNNGTKVIYTAHGFHFCKDTPFWNRLLYYPIEKLCSKQTDLLITINEEDFSFAKRKLPIAKIVYVPGVGIDTKRFATSPAERQANRIKLSVRENAFLMLSIGELSQNKNHKTIIRALATLKSPDIHYIIAGEGKEEKALRRLAKKLGVADRVHLLGYRYDIPELCKLADLYIHPSYREGLPIAVIEAMASGLPVIGSDIRGNRELIDSKGGTLCTPNDIQGFAKAIIQHRNDRTLALAKGAYNAQKARAYEKDDIDRMILQLYRNEAS